MVEAGLLAKSTSKKDRRLVEIEITEAGRRLLNDIIPEAMSLETRLMEGFSETEADQFGVLRELLHNELDKHPSTPQRSRMDISQPRR